MVRSRTPNGGQTWKTFIRNHAGEIFAADFLIQYTALFTTVYIFVVTHVASRRIVLINATASRGLAYRLAAQTARSYPLHGPRLSRGCRTMQFGGHGKGKRVAQENRRVAGEWAERSEVRREPGLLGTSGLELGCQVSERGRGTHGRADGGGAGWSSRRA
jgi:hypothetical protein